MVRALASNVVLLVVLLEWPWFSDSVCRPNEGLYKSGRINGITSLNCIGSQLVATYELKGSLFGIIRGLFIDCDKMELISLKESGSFVMLNLEYVVNINISNLSGKSINCLFYGCYETENAYLLPNRSCFIFPHELNSNTFSATPVASSMNETHTEEFFGPFQTDSSKFFGPFQTDGSIVTSSNIQSALVFSNMTSDAAASSSVIESDSVTSSMKSAAISSSTVTSNVTHGMKLKGMTNYILSVVLPVFGSIATLVMIVLFGVTISNWCKKWKNREGNGRTCNLQFDLEIIEKFDPNFDPINITEAFSNSTSIESLVYDVFFYDQSEQSSLSVPTDYLRTDKHLLMETNSVSSDSDPYFLCSEVRPDNDYCLQSHEDPTDNTEQDVKSSHSKQTANS